MCDFGRKVRERIGPHFSGEGKMLVMPKASLGAHGVRTFLVLTMSSAKDEKEIAQCHWEVGH
jgi:hypothetical protein